VYNFVTIGRKPNIGIDEDVQKKTCVSVAQPLSIL